MVDYLLSNKQATVQEVRDFLDDEYDIDVSYDTVRRAMKAAHLTRKVVGKILRIYTYIGINRSYEELEALILL